jgi:hypothetical protein
LRQWTQIVNCYDIGLFRGKILAFQGSVSYNQLQLNTAGGRMEKIPYKDRPYADRALETPIKLGAEGASAAALNSQAKGQRFPPWDSMVF